MRVTQSMYYNNMYGNNNKLNQQLFDVNKQIASGHTIQYAHEGVTTFSETLRLDNEITTLTQVGKSSNSGLKFSEQSDTTLTEFKTTLDSFRTKLIQAANDTQTLTTREAIASDLEALRTHLVNLANTSTNGKFLFSGSATSVKPVNDDGTYNGNDGDLFSFGGLDVQQKYNVSGAELFLGDDSNINRTVTTNMPMPDRINGGYVTTASTIRDLVGDNNSVETDNPDTYFYLRGTKHDGTTFQQQVVMSPDQEVGELLKSIGEAFGNTPANTVVNVSLNDRGQVVIEDRISGSSKLDFHIVGATDFSGALNLDLAASGQPIESVLNSQDVVITSFVRSNVSEYTATVGQINTLDTDVNGDPIYALSANFLTNQGETVGTDTLLSDIVLPGVDTLQLGTGFNLAVAGATMQDLLDTISVEYDVQATLSNGRILFGNDSLGNNPNVSVSSLSGGLPVDSMPSNSDISYDRASFDRDGSTLQASVPQIVKADNSYATMGTTLEAVAASPLDGKVFNLEGYNVGGTPFTAQIIMNPAGVQIDVNGTLYPVPSATFNDVDGDGVYTAGVDTDNPTLPSEFTYQQLSDIVGMVTAGVLPADVNGVGGIQYDEYYQAVRDASLGVDVSLSYNGLLTVEQRNTTTTQASLRLYDANSSTFNTDAPVLQFNANNALTIRDPKNDLFAKLDEAIASVRKNDLYADGNFQDPRNGGIENAIQKVDDVMEHVGKQHVKAGVQSNALMLMIERTETLKVSATALQSDVIDTDIAEATIRLQQLNLNYQALLSSVARVSELSLVNYL